MKHILSALLEDFRDKKAFYIPLMIALGTIIIGMYFSSLY